MEQIRKESKDKKKKKGLKEPKRLCILLLFIFLYLGLQIVNQNIVELNC